MVKTKPLESLSLKGLSLAPPQVFAGVRLVPVLRENPPGDLRLGLRRYDEDVNVALLDEKTAYCSYAPHALVASWASDSSSPRATFGSQLAKTNSGTKKDGKVHDLGFATARVMSKIRSREEKNRLRFLPMDVAMEGFLAFHFGGSPFAWEEYSRAATKFGLGSRYESTIRGSWIAGLEDALRVFEIHENQVGVLIFVADALASVFVVSHPDDYLNLHQTLIQDFYGELIFYYGLVATENSYSPSSIDQEKINSIADLRQELDRVREDWAELHQLMVGKLFDRPIDSQESYRLGPFSMQHFKTNLNPKLENHIGESIVRSDGTIEYLKTYRLSAAQCRRAYLLKQLAAASWELEKCAAELNCSKNQLIFRVEKAGFGYLLHQHVLDSARAQARKRS